MSDDAEPPRKFFQLKPREFEAVNDVPAAAPPPNEPIPLPKDPGPMAPTAGRIDLQDIIRDAAMPGSVLTSTRATAENDVHKMLRLNHAHAEARGLNALKIQLKRRSKRRRDYFVLLAAGNLFIVTVYSAELLLGFQVMCLAAQMPQEFGHLIVYALHQPTAFAMAGAGMAFFSAALTWLMFGVMNEY